MRSIDKKFGKMLRLDFDIKDNKLVYIKISGDFFIHPEDAIDAIEELILNKDLNDIEGLLNDYVINNQIKIVGFSVSEFVSVLKS